MTVTCPKCAHQRKPTDTNPDWQCPACGIAYQKYINEQNKASNVEAIQPPAPAFTSQAVSIGEAGAKRSTPKLFGGIALLIGFLSVRYAMTTYQHNAENAAWERENKIQSELQTKAVLKARAPKVQQLTLPAESMNDLFVSAHSKGEAQAIGFLTTDNGGQNRVGKLNLSVPANFNVVREAPLAQPDCDRFRVTITQGEETASLPGGRLAKKPIGSQMQLKYLINYCVDGTMPQEGRNTEVI